MKPRQVTENGNFREAEFYDGEVYDATVNLEKASFHNASIEKVKIRSQLLAQYGSLVKAHEQLNQYPARYLRRVC